MAEALLKGWNAPALVSSVTIDARHGKAIDERERDGRAIGSRMAMLCAGREIEEWTAAAADLEQRWDWHLLLRITDIQQALNQEPLRVTGLECGAVQVDDRRACG